MAKRRTKIQINADRIIKAKLLILGEEIREQAVRTSRRDTGRLQDEQNFRVQPDTTLTMAQVYYGKFNYPKGVNSGEKNALMIAVKEHVPKGTKIIITEINDQLLAPFKNKRE
jgi:hypothetical protein